MSNLKPSKNWPIEKLHYLIMNAGSMPFELLAEYLEKNTDSVRKKLSRMNYLGKLPSGWNL